ncbi:MAG: caspase family protein [Saprospiraceae bacterium]|nr:caspase family protein [Saprospiraceae bacterium]MBK7738515.1 caspase family protein [Saprospiraceae bacterium]MBK7912913.1 caspase family protein [Saprospiraceae bacterium]
MKKKLIHSSSLFTSGYLLCWFLFSTASGLAQHVSGNTKALVIGLSHYQDPEIKELPFPQRDAELFASYLLANNSFKLDKENLMVLVDKEATAAGVASALDWLAENTKVKDTVIFYFSGYAGYQFRQSESNAPIYYYDSPASQSTSNAFDLFRQFNKIVKSKKLNFYCFGILYPLVSPSVLAQDSIQTKTWNIQVESFPNKFSISSFLNSTEEVQTRSISGELKSFNHYLLEALIGKADFNQDLSIDFNELNAYLNKTKWSEDHTPGFLFAGCSSRKKGYIRVDPKLSTNLIQLDKHLTATILEPNETKRNELSLNQLAEKDRSLYQDFLVAIQLGHLMTPSDRNASMLLDSMLRLSPFINFHGAIKRRLAAALQDETQQVLNAYLNFDNREIAKRRNKTGAYLIYSDYCRRASDLLGKDHFLNKMLTVKYFYFLGLQKRIDGERNFNNQFIEEALLIQKQSLQHEKQAAFIYNEIGINCSLLGKKDEAKINYEKAIENSPSWSIPFANLSQMYLDEDLNKALRLAKHAIRLSPNNSYGYNVEGLVYLESKNYNKAESSFLKAIEIDEKFQDAYYNLACIKSLQADFQMANNYLELAIQNGFYDFKHLKSDPDLEAFRKQIQWLELSKKYFADK